MSELLTCQKISFSYNQRQIFSDLSFSIQPQEFWVVSGESGVGKSTLLKVLSGELKPSSGFIQKPQLWSEIPQGLALCSGLSAQDTIAAGSLGSYPWWKTFWGLPKKSLQKAQGLAHKLKISHVISHDVSRLSGGEKQRVAMARALMGDAKLFFVDEPISMLDEGLALEALLALKEEVFARQGSLICVLHQTQMIKNFATHQIILNSKGWKIL